MKQSYSMPTRICFGEGAIAMLPDCLPVTSAKRIALCTGGSSLRKNGFLDQILGILKGKELEMLVTVPAEPSLSHLRAVTKGIQEFSPQCIIAIGGGSVLDTAKAAAFCAGEKVDVADVLAHPPAYPSIRIPVVAIPTTAGTGSEVTPFAVFWEKKEKKKYSLGNSPVGSLRQRPNGGPALFPSDAILDPLLTHSMPPAVTASTGMDAFTQACEAYWNRDCNPMSDDYALAAIRRILPMLPRAVKNGSDAEARSEMLLGSLQAGLAFSNTRTAACHSISYPMTLHFDVPHGQAVGITLPEVLLLNATVAPDRVSRFCDALGVSSMRDAAETIRTMMKKSGLKTRLSDLGMGEDAIPLIVREGFTPERMGNNPYEFTPESLTELLLRIL